MNSRMDFGEQSKYLHLPIAISTNSKYRTGEDRKSISVVDSLGPEQSKKKGLGREIEVQIEKVEKMEKERLKKKEIGKKFGVQNKKLELNKVQYFKVAT